MSWTISSLSLKLYHLLSLLDRVHIHLLLLSKTFSHSHQYIFQTCFYVIKIFIGISLSRHYIWNELTFSSVFLFTTWHLFLSLGFLYSFLLYFCNFFSCSLACFLLTLIPASWFTLYTLYYCERDLFQLYF